MVYDYFKPDILPKHIETKSSAATIGEAGYAMHSLARFYVMGGAHHQKGKIKQFVIKKKMENIHSIFL